MINDNKEKKMKAVIDYQDVFNAIKELVKQNGTPGYIPTISDIYKFLGEKGSLTTISKFQKQYIDEERQREKDSSLIEPDVWQQVRDNTVSLFKILNAKNIAEKEVQDKVHSEELQQLAEKIDALEKQNGELTTQLEEKTELLSRSNSEIQAAKMLNIAYEKMKGEYLLLKDSYDSLKNAQESALAAKDQVIATLQKVIDNFQKNK